MTSADSWRTSADPGQGAASEAVAGKEKGDPENGIIAVLIG